MRPYEIYRPYSAFRIVKDASVEMRRNLYMRRSKEAANLFTHHW